MFVLILDRAAAIDHIIARAVEPRVPEQFTLRLRPPEPHAEAPAWPWEQLLRDLQRATAAVALADAGAYHLAPHR